MHPVWLGPTVGTDPGDPKEIEMATIPWIDDLDAGLQRSAEEGRFVLLDFFSPT
jgi:hypothetical protein